MQIQEIAKRRLDHIQRERLKLLSLLEEYGASDPDISKSDKCRHTIRELMEQEKAFHITEIESAVGIDDVKGVIHQVLNGLRESGEVIAFRINGSNQKYFYASSKAKSGSGIKDEYYPMPKHYVNEVEVM